MQNGGLIVAGRVAATLALLLSTLVFGGTSVAEAQSSIGPPVCNESNPASCLFVDDGITAEVSGLWSEGEVATVTIDPGLPACADVTAPNCYNRVSEPSYGGCFEIRENDPSNIEPCSMLHRFQQSFERPGARATPTGGSCKGSFDYVFFEGGPGNVPGATWPERGPALLKCSMTWNGFFDFPVLHGPTFLKVFSTVHICISHSGASCVEFDQIQVQYWVEVSGEVLPNTPIAQCSIVWRDSEPDVIIVEDESTLTGPNPITTLRTTWVLPEGLEWETNETIGRIVDVPPGTHIFEITAEALGQDAVDVSTCEIFIPEGANPTLCDGLAITVDLGSGQMPTAGDDVILGTAEADVIDALEGDDTICAEAGDDTVVGGDGDDTIFGGPGRDIIRGGPGVDTIHGEGDADRLLGGIEGDTINGGVGDDYIGGFGGGDTIDGGPGNDRIFGGFGADVINGGPGADTINGLIGNDIIDGGGGADTVNGDAGNDTVRGGPGNDIVSGGNASDSVFGDGGNDTLGGGKADDTLDGGGGVDVCSGNKHVVSDTVVNCETVFGVP